MADKRAATEVSAAIDAAGSGGSSGVLANDTYFQIRNADNDSNIDIFKLDTDDILTFASSPTPTESGELDLGNQDRNWNNLWTGQVTWVDQNDQSKRIIGFTDSIVDSWNFSLPSEIGTAGQALVIGSITGMGTTAVLEWASSGGGANTALSNLDPTTAVNQDLIFDIGIGVNAFLRTKDNTIATEGMFIRSGDSSTDRTGSAGIFTGEPAANFVSGSALMQTGDCSGTGESGSIFISSGGSASGNSGGININSGESTSGGESGEINISSGLSSTFSGSISIVSGNCDGSGAETGTVAVASGSSEGGDTSTGNVILSSGTPSGTGTRGTIVFLNGSEGTAGYVWTSTNTTGSGSWAPAPGGILPFDTYYQIIGAAATPVDIFKIDSISEQFTFAVNPVVSALRRPGGVVDTVDLSNMVLRDPGNTIRIDWSGGLLNDDSGLQALQFTTRQLLNATGDVLLDWSGSNPVPGVTNTVNLGASNKTWAKTFTNTIARGGSTATIIDVNTFQLNDVGGLRINWTDGTINDPSIVQSINFNTRVLTNTNGFTVLDWGGPSTIISTANAAAPNNNTGDVSSKTGGVSGNGTSGNNTIVTGSNTSGAGSSGAINIKTGETDAGTTGDVTLTIGSTSSGIRGNIKFEDGSEGTAGDVWTSIGTNGAGAWRPGVLAFTSDASAGGSDTETLTVTGLLATDTILSVTQQTPGSNLQSLIGWSGVVDDSITAQWTADPGSGAVVIVAVKR